jgi:hypothetical protein
VIAVVELVAPQHHWPRLDARSDQLYSSVRVAMLDGMVCTDAYHFLLAPGTFDY